MKLPICPTCGREFVSYLMLVAFGCGCYFVVVQFVQTLFCMWPR